MIEREEQPSQIVRFAVCGGARRHKADMRGHWGKCGKKRDRFELRTVARAAARSLRVVAPANGQLVGEENEVEQAALRGLYDVQEIFEVHRAFGRNLWVTPRGDMVPHP